MIGGLFETYEDYLASDMWKEKKRLMIQKNPFCQICKEPLEHWEIIRYKKTWKRIWHYGENNYVFVKLEDKQRPVYGIVGKKLTVHHKTYDSVCNEPAKDLMVVCFGCHNDIHDINKKCSVKPLEKK